MSLASLACVRGRLTGFLALLVLCMCALTDTAAAQAATAPDCLSAQACFPWENNGTASTNPCRRGSRFNLRFMLQVAKENEQTSDGRTFKDAIYAFCPTVDHLQSFNLRTAPFLAGAHKVTTDDKETYELTHSLSLSYLSVFGFGNTNNTFYPEPGLSAGSVVFAQNGSSVCGMFRSLAVVTTLVLDVGLRDGRFNYAGATQGGMQLVANPNYNNETCWALTNRSSSSASPIPDLGSSSSSSTAIDYCSEQIEVYVPPNIAQPMKTGFVPTCTTDKQGDDRCLFDENQICIGNPGQKNCAKCYARQDAEKLAKEATVQVWTSYYGTDSRGYTLKSGGNNPINFGKFARADMLNTLGTKLSDLWKRNTTEVPHEDET